MTNQETFQFAVDSALLSELGERLVSTVHVALAELVKNAYDADAATVTLSILPEDGRAPRVIVDDDGLGMTLDQVRRFWMKIGTSNKVLEPHSEKYGRLKTGSKGVGRFACRRLGSNLLLITCARVDGSGSARARWQTTRVEFDWASFKPGIDVESVDCIGETSISSTGKAGTRLEIWGGPYDEWQTRGFNYLQRQLALLASNRGAKRTGFDEDPGFNIHLNAPEFSGTPIDVREEIVRASWGTLTAAVGDDGRAICTLNAKGLGGTKKLVSKQRFKQIAGATLHIGVLPTRKDEARKPELLAEYVLSDLVDQWGGIHIRFNGFRVFPYGDPRDDWLDIDADRGRRIGKPEGELFDFALSLDRVDAPRSLLNMLGMRNYIGQVDVTSEIKLIPRIDRQGFLENEAFDEVRRFTRFAVDWANIYRDHYIRLRENEEADRARQAVRPVLNLEGPKELVVPKAATFLRREIRRLVKRLPPTQQAETEKTLIRTVHAIETTSVESYKQLEHLRLVASASTLTLLFAHEVRTAIGTLGAAALRLGQLSKAFPNQRNDLNTLSVQLGDTKQRLDGLVSMTGIVGAFRRTSEPIDIHLETAIKRAVRCFQLIKENYDIDINDAEIPTDLVVGPMLEGELYTILLNLTSNAIKSVIAAGRTSRKICFLAKQDGKNIIIQVLDNGLGLAEQFVEEVFTPFIADPSGELYDRLEERANPEDASILGTGSGLGLSIARDVARSRGGDIHFLSPPTPWNACVQVELP
jgi:signal transduction histidine kinase